MTSTERRFSRAEVEGIDAPSCDLDLWSDEVLLDPWPHYRMIRDLGPAVYLERYDLYAVGRYEGVRAVTRNWEAFTSAQGVAFNDLMNEAEIGTSAGSDPPEHGVVRALLSERLHLSDVRELSGILEARAGALVGELVARGSFDAVTDLARRYVTEVIGDIMGITGDVLDRFAPAGNVFFDAVGPEGDRCYEAVPVAIELLGAIGRLTKADMAPGGVGWRLFEAQERGEMPGEDPTIYIWNFLGPAFDTTINGIGSTIWMLARDPEQWAALRENPSLVDAAFNEGLRMESPIQIWGRACRAGAALDGMWVPPGTRIALLLGSANRDERHYPDPDIYRVDRNPRDHVAFGHGVHTCLGASLARAEAHAVLAALVDQVTTLACGAPTRVPRNTTRGLTSLPVTVS
jgi:cytochrome P450